MSRTQNKATAKDIIVSVLTLFLIVAISFLIKEEPTKLSRGIVAKDNRGKSALDVSISSGPPVSAQVQDSGISGDEGEDLHKVRDYWQRRLGFVGDQSESDKLRIALEEHYQIPSGIPAGKVTFWEARGNSPLSWTRTLSRSLAPCQSWRM